MRLRRDLKGNIRIILENKEEIEWFENVVRFHSVSDEGEERDQKVLDKLDELEG